MIFRCYKFDTDELRCLQRVCCLANSIIHFSLLLFHQLFHVKTPRAGFSIDGANWPCMGWLWPGAFNLTLCFPLTCSLVLIYVGLIALTQKFGYSYDHIQAKKKPWVPRCILIPFIDSSFLWLVWDEVFLMIFIECVGISTVNSHFSSITSEIISIKVGRKWVEMKACNQITQLPDKTRYSACPPCTDTFEPPKP